MITNVLLFISVEISFWYTWDNISAMYWCSVQTCRICFFHECSLIIFWEEQTTPNSFLCNKCFASSVVNSPLNFIARVTDTPIVSLLNDIEKSVILEFGGQYSNSISVLISLALNSIAIISKDITSDHTEVPPALGVSNIRLPPTDKRMMSGLVTYIFMSCWTTVHRETSSMHEWAIKSFCTVVVMTNSLRTAWKQGPLGRLPFLIFKLLASFKIPLEGTKGTLISCGKDNRGAAKTAMGADCVCFVGRNPILRNPHHSFRIWIATRWSRPRRCRRVRHLV